MNNQICSTRALQNLHLTSTFQSIVVNSIEIANRASRLRGKSTAPTFPCSCNYALRCCCFDCVIPLHLAGLYVLFTIFAPQTCLQAQPMLLDFSEVVRNGVQTFSSIFHNQDRQQSVPDDDSPTSNTPSLPARSNASTTTSHRVQMPRPGPKFRTKTLSAHLESQDNPPAPVTCVPINVSETLQSGHGWTD